jgi:chaperonin GroES
MLRPLNNKVLVVRDEAEEKTESGIYLPEKAKDKPQSGTVRAVGPGEVHPETGERTPMTVEEGDRVLFTSYAGTEVKIDGEDMLIMSESEILAVVD